uniref:Putative methyltransferase n=1 Tax=viral metagenome TaxID=1070528 RepID=A0A6M3XY91_9ZZZZ
MSDEERLEVLSEAHSSDIYYAVRTLYDSILKHNYKTVLELGVRSGVSTRVLLLAVKKVGGHVWSVDVARCELAQRIVCEWGLASYWTFIQMDDRDFAGFWNRKVDMLFIDTSHQYEHTLFELELYSKFVGENGVIYLHDTISHKEGVMQAILDFIKKHPEWEFKEEGIIHGLGALRRR